MNKPLAILAAALLIASCAPASPPGPTATTTPPDPLESESLEYRPAFAEPPRHYRHHAFTATGYRKLAPPYKPRPTEACPVKDSRTEFSNSFGYRKPSGRRHQGVDMYARRGQPAVALYDGHVLVAGWNRLGGKRVWLRTAHGDFYYSHLDAYASGLHRGQRLRAGETLGYVGNTGNARGTKPHIHFEYHPRGRGTRAANPYRLLVDLCR